MVKPLTISQIALLAGVDERKVHLDMRRGHLPSQEPEVVREWLYTIWERKNLRRLTREERYRG
jgi:hypothetical protein